MRAARFETAAIATMSPLSQEETSDETEVINSSILCGGGDARICSIGGRGGRHYRD
jgi:hypothetical protein